MTDYHLPQALADKMRLNKPHREKVRMIRRNFALAADSNDILNILSDARPFAFKTWNAYISVITAAPDSRDLYVKKLLELADEVIRELDPNYVRSSSFKGLEKSAEEVEECRKKIEALKNLAQTRNDWPRLISNQQNGKINAERLCAELGLGTKAGAKRADAGVPGDVAEMVIEKIRESTVCLRHSWTIPKKHWEFYYVVKEPPPYDVEHSAKWEKLVGAVLDHYYGYAEKRTEARRERLESETKNLFLVSERDPSSAQRMIRERWNKERTSENFVENELKKLDQWDIREYGDSPCATPKTNHWHDEPLPCILAFPEVRIFCDNKFRKTRVKGPKAAYNQFRREVLNSVAARLPRSPQ